MSLTSVYCTVESKRNNSENDITQQQYGSSLMLNYFTNISLFLQTFLNKENQCFLKQITTINVHIKLIMFHLVQIF